MGCRARAWMWGIVVSCFALSACGQAGSPSPGTSALSQAPESPQTTSSLLPTATAKTGPECTSPSETILACGTFKSVEGTGTMAWVAAEPTTLTLERQAGSMLLSMTTPCNGLSSPATATATQVHVEQSKMVVGAMACPEAIAVKERAASDFLLASPAYSLANETLLLTTPSGSVKFVRVGGP